MATTLGDAPATSDADPWDDELLQLPIGKIRPSPYQPRKEFDEAELDELGASMNAIGLLEPIVVRSFLDATGNHYELIAGERRLRAAKKLGWLVIPGIVRQMTDRDAATGALVENLQRKDLAPTEEARGYRDLMQLNGWTQQQLHDATGKPRSTIGDRLALLELPAIWLEALEQGDVTVSQAVELRKYAGEPEERHAAAFDQLVAAAGAGRAIADLELASFRALAAGAYAPALPPEATQPPAASDDDSGERTEREPRETKPAAGAGAGEEPAGLRLFSALAPIAGARLVVITIAPGKNGQLTVGVMPKALHGEKTAPAALTLSGTAEELDRDFPGKLEAFAVDGVDLAKPTPAKSGGRRAAAKSAKGGGKKKR